jgi:dihydroorotate dehydrogenase (fumarate)
MNLSTTYLGLPLKNPLVAASGPASGTLDGMKRMEDAGVAAITMFSLFEEQIEHEMRLMGEYLDQGSESYAEATRYLPEPTSYHRGPDEYLALISEARASLGIPVIASLNGSSTGGWIEYARQIEQAGASALELNIYWIETDATVQGAEVEQRYLDVVASVTKTVRIPVAVKIGPYFSSLGHVVAGFRDRGAAGVVLFNRFYQPDFDILAREVRPSIALSSNHELRLPLHWTAILSGQVGLDIAVSGGVHAASDVVKAIMAGARVATFASCVIQSGVSAISRMRADLETWMTGQGYESVDQLRGIMSHRRVADPSAFERANYMKELQSFRPDRSVLR